MFIWKSPQVVYDFLGEEKIVWISGVIYHFILTYPQVTFIQLTSGY